LQRGWILKATAKKEREEKKKEKKAAAHTASNAGRLSAKQQMILTE